MLTIEQTSKLEKIQVEVCKAFSLPSIPLELSSKNLRSKYGHYSWKNYRFIDPITKKSKLFMHSQVITLFSSETRYFNGLVDTLIHELGHHLANVKNGMNCKHDYRFKQAHYIIKSYCKVKELY